MSGSALETSGLDSKSINHQSSIVGMHEYGLTPNLIPAADDDAVPAQSV